MPLSFSEKESLIASALGIESYYIQDVYDDSVVYRTTGSPSRYYQCSYSISTENKVTTGTPQQVIRRTQYEPIVQPATFTMGIGDVVASETAVKRSGKIFEAGLYPDKGFSITEEELDTAVASFAPVLNNDSHYRGTLFDGKLGSLNRVWREGKELFGEVEVPQWLNTLWGSDPLKASLEFARDSKSIVGCALCLNPRVSDAQLTAAFTAATNQPTDKGKTTMSKLGERIAALFAGRKPEEVPDTEYTAIFTEESKKTEEKPEVTPAQPTAEFTALQTENAGLRAAALAGAAKDFYLAMFTAKKCVPAEQASIEAQYRQAVMDDNAGKACFSGDGAVVEGDRVKTLRALFDARPTINFDTEQIQGVDTITLTAATPVAVPTITEDRRKELLSIR